MEQEALILTEDNVIAVISEASFTSSRLVISALVMDL